eukprot:3195084-Alexandrium_andersonii.AAC.1
MPVSEAVFKFTCPSGCGQVLATSGRPVPTPAGEWPKVPCSQCGCPRRVGKAVCVACLRQLRACKCSPAEQSRAERCRVDVRALLGMRRA